MFADGGSTLPPRESVPLASVTEGTGDICSFSVPFAALKKRFRPSSGLVPHSHLSVQEPSPTRTSLQTSHSLSSRCLPMALRASFSSAWYQDQYQAARSHSDGFPTTSHGAATASESVASSSSSPNEAVEVASESPPPEDHRAHQDLLRRVVSVLDVQTVEVCESSHNLVDILDSTAPPGWLC